MNKIKGVNMFIIELKLDKIKEYYEAVIKVVSSFEIKGNELFVEETMHQWGPPPIKSHKLEDIERIRSSNGDVLFDEKHFEKIIKNYNELFGKNKETK